MCEAVAIQSTITVQEVIGTKLVNDDDGSGMDRDTVCRGNSELRMVRHEVPRLFLIVVMVCTHHCKAHYTKRELILNIHLSLLVYRSITISE